MDDSMQLQRKSNEKFKLKAHKIEHVIPIVPLYFYFSLTKLKLKKTNLHDLHNVVAIKMRN